MTAFRRSASCLVPASTNPYRQVRILPRVSRGALQFCATPNLTAHRGHGGVPAHPEGPGHPATESSSWPTRRQISARARSVSAERARMALEASVQVCVGQSGSGQRQRRRDQTSTTGRPAMGRSIPDLDLPAAVAHRPGCHSRHSRPPPRSSPRPATARRPPRSGRRPRTRPCRAARSRPRYGGPCQGPPVLAAGEKPQESRGPWPRWWMPPTGGTGRTPLSDCLWKSPLRRSYGEVLMANAPLTHRTPPTLHREEPIDRRHPISRPNLSPRREHPTRLSQLGMLGPSRHRAVRIRARPHPLPPSHPATTSRRIADCHPPPILRPGPCPTRAATHDRRGRLDLDDELTTGVDHIEYLEAGRAEPARTTTFTHRGASLSRTFEQSRDSWGSPSHGGPSPGQPSQLQRAGPDSAVIGGDGLGGQGVEHPGGQPVVTTSRKVDSLPLPRVPATSQEQPVTRRWRMASKQDRSESRGRWQPSG